MAGKLVDRLREYFRREQPTLLMPPYSIHERECPCCAGVVAIWRTYGDGTIECVECATARAQQELADAKE